MAAPYYNGNPLWQWRIFVILATLYICGNGESLLYWQPFVTMALQRYLTFVRVFEIELIHCLALGL